MPPMLTSLAFTSTTPCRVVQATVPHWSVWANLSFRSLHVGPVVHVPVVPCMLFVRVVIGPKRKTRPETVPLVL